MDLSILTIWSQAKLSVDHVACTKVRTVLGAQPVGSAVTAQISYQTSIDWGTPSGCLENGLMLVETPYICDRINPGSVCPLIWGLRLPYIQGSNKSRSLAPETLTSKLCSLNSWQNHILYLMSCVTPQQLALTLPSTCSVSWGKLSAISSPEEGKYVTYTL